MNSDEVVEMIDAITEGREFTLSVPVPLGEDSLTLKFHEDEISVYGAHGFATGIRNPRNVREIAGALVAWANRKQNGNIDLATVVKLFGDGRPEFPSVNDWAHIKNGRDTRENWYKRSAPSMTLETLKRNRQDNQGILDKTTDENVRMDIIRALNVMDDELYKRDQG